MDQETVRRLEQALDGALSDIRETLNDDFRRLKMGEYRGLKIAAAICLRKQPKERMENDAGDY